MTESENHEIKDAKWEPLNTEVGEIKFIKIEKGRKVKALFKGITFILIAAISGGVTASYIVDKKNVSKPYSYNNSSLFEQEERDNKSVDVSKNAITRVAESIGPTVVGINSLAEGFRGKIVSQDNGSGIIFDSRGYIVTNYHVIESAAKLTVKLSSGKVLEAKVVGQDKKSDLAVIKVQAENLPVAKFGDSSKVKVGDIAIAIGNPLGDEYAGTVTAGIISALNRRIQVDDTVYKVLQTDAAINPGNSGGALCNAVGEVIGINSLKLGGTQNIEGMGFAISINEARDIIKALTENGKVSRANLGIVAGAAIQAQNKGVKGVYIQEVALGSGAATAGVRPTDIIIELDNVKIVEFKDLADVIEKHKIGDVVVVKVWRSGKILDINVTLTERK